MPAGPFLSADPHFKAVADLTLAMTPCILGAAPSGALTHGGVGNHPMLIFCIDIVP